MARNERIIDEGLNQVLLIAQERALTLENLKQALIKNDSERIKDYAKQLCGLNNEGDRISQGIHTTTRR